MILKKVSKNIIPNNSTSLWKAVKKQNTIIILSYQTLSTKAELKLTTKTLCTKLRTQASEKLKNGRVIG